MPGFKAVIVVPTCRPESMYEFLDRWRDEFCRHKIIVTEDSRSRQIDFSRYPNVEAYSAAEWSQEWGRDAWILPRNNAGHRAFGYWKAWTYSQRHECDMIVTLDDDCHPDQPGYLAKHHAALGKKQVLEWTTSLPIEWPHLTRGFPYSIREGRPVMVNHGVWSHVPDLDACTQILHPGVRLPVISRESKLIPWGTYFPFCGMNVAWKPEVTPLLYFLLMGIAWPYDRFDDIWAGLFLKKICDQMRWCITSGMPSVRHNRLSNVSHNLKREASGLAENEQLWEHVHRIQLTGADPLDHYLQIAQALDGLGGNYFPKLAAAMRVWITKFR
ncbi:MAG TPA: hypothetical protein VL981_07080 [Candidatus Methylacidiphilales bacterium]|nr:hypothetical protein [Candidatus Methylacidiphilales bacterium]